MKLQLFEMERWQSTWENRVEYNLSESGVHPLRVNELLDGADAEFLNQPLEYTQSNGTDELRKTIAAVYPGAEVDNLLVTNGSSEANFVSTWSFLERGGEVVVMLPNYMQIWGLAKTFQAKVKSFRLRERDSEWKPDLTALRRAVNRKTKLIAVCNPNNPTGAVMREETLDEICEIARRAGAWILADEVYQGSELDGKTTPTFWGRYEKVIVVNGLSKAYGLPGIRVGWIVSTKDVASKLWSYHDYTTICPSALNDYLARKALQPGTRARILARTREILETNLPIITSWIEHHKENFSLIPPQAGAIAYVKYNLKINSSKFAERLMKEKSTLIVPGDHFGMDGYLRIGYGPPKDYLYAGLNRIDELVEDIKQRK
jgi:aspartate/methionine/tyrosine aminotransferase